MKHLYIVILLACCIQIKSQQWKWAKNIAFNTGNATLTVVKPGENGNFYAGVIEGTLSAHILKFDSLGNELWRKNFPGNYRLFNISRNDSSLFLGGAYYGTITINNQQYSSSGGSDIFFAKLSLNGNVEWCKCVGGNNDDVCNSVCADHSGNIYLTGSYAGTMDFDGHFLSGNSNSMLFIAKYGSSGNMKFLKSATTTDAQHGYSTGQRIQTNPNQRIYLLGEANNMKLDTFTFVDYQLYGNQFITSIDSTGLFEAPYEIGPGVNEVSSFAFRQCGDLLFTGWDGWTGGSMSVSRCYSTNYSVKYSAIESGYCWGDSWRGYSIAAQKNNCYITGSFEMGPNCNEITAHYFLIVKYDSLGHRLLKDTIRGTVGESLIVNDKTMAL